MKAVIMIFITSPKKCLLVYKNMGTNSICQICLMVWKGSFTVYVFVLSIYWPTWHSRVGPIWSHYILSLRAPYLLIHLTQLGGPHHICISDYFWLHETYSSLNLQCFKIFHQYCYIIFYLQLFVDLCTFQSLSAQCLHKLVALCWQSGRKTFAK